MNFKEYAREHLSKYGFTDTDLALISIGWNARGESYNQESANGSVVFQANTQPAAWANVLEWMSEPLVYPFASKSEAEKAAARNSGTVLPLFFADAIPPAEGKSLNKVADNEDPGAYIDEGTKAVPGKDIDPLFEGPDVSIEDALGAMGEEQRLNEEHFSEDYQAPEPEMQSEMPGLTSSIINDCSWAFVEAMPHRLPGPIFNDLKPAIYEAIKRYEAGRPQANAGRPAVAWNDPAVDPIVTKLYRKFNEWSQRGFTADDVTWCEVRAYIAELLNTQPPAKVPEGWKPANNMSAELPEIGQPVMGYHPDWIDEDFCKDGIRECFLFGDGSEWQSARWDGYCDQWIAEDGAPKLWHRHPNPPQQEGE